MSVPSSPRPPAPSDAHLLLAYVAELELEVNRLRKHGEFVRQEVREGLQRIRRLAAYDGGAPALAEVGETVKHLAGVLRDLHDPPGYHPARDQVVAIAVRPLAEQVFRWQQRLAGAPDAELRLELTVEHVEWFPARLRHILDNLLSNALKYRDTGKAGAWVHLALQALPAGYELRVSDNGLGMPPAERGQVLDLFYRTAPDRAAGLGVGLAVVKMLVEQSGGTLALESGEGTGSTFTVLLPRYDIHDFLT